MSLYDIDPGPDSPEVVRSIIEIPAHSANKYEYDGKLGVFRMDRALYSPMHYPGDYGFIPGTLADDNDPLDVLVLMDEPAFPGVKTTCRIVGVIEGEQVDKKKAERNDRVVAVEHGNHDYAHVKRIDDLGEPEGEIIAFDDADTGLPNPLSPQRPEFRHRLVPIAKHQRLLGRQLCQIARQVCFGVVYIDSLHDYIVDHEVN